MRDRSDLIEEEITHESDDQAHFSLRVFRCCHQRKIHVGHAGDHVGVFNLAADGAANNAGLNVVSANTAFSACEVSGHETAHGTLKISHVNPGPDPLSDADAAAISIDLQASEGGRMAAQGIFLKSTTGGSSGKNSELCRFQGSDDFRLVAGRIVTASPGRRTASRDRCWTETLQCQWHPRSCGFKRRIYPAGLKSDKEAALKMLRESLEHSFTRCRSTLGTVHSA
jgi:hypothetical protein